MTLKYLPGGRDHTELPTHNPNKNSKDPSPVGGYLLIAAGVAMLSLGAYNYFTRDHNFPPDNVNSPPTNSLEDRVVD